MALVNDAEQYPGLQQQADQLEKALASQLYSAAFGSAAYAYYEAYTDAVIGFILYFQRYVGTGNHVTSYHVTSYCII